MKIRASRSLAIAATSLYVITALMSAVIPLIPKHAAADTPTAVELSYGGKSESTAAHINKTGDEGFKLTNCQGKMTQQPLSSDVLYRSLGPRNPLDEVLNIQNYSGSGFAANIGNSYNWHNASYDKFYKANLGSEVPTITFESAPGGSKSTMACGGDTANARFTLIPVSSSNNTEPANSNVWIGLQSWYNINSSSAVNTSPQNEWWGIRFTANPTTLTSSTNSTAGKLEYLYTNNNGSSFSWKTWNNFVIDGVPKPANTTPGTGIGVGIGNVTSAKFLDAANIQVTSSVDGNPVTEVYTDSYWDDKPYFFLTKSSLVSRDNNLTMAVQSGDPKATPLTAADPTTNKIPFIYIGADNPNSSTPKTLLCDKTCDSKNLQNGINNYVKQVSLYDYNIDGSRIGASGTGLPEKKDLKSVTDTARAKVWFYVSNANKSAMPVFTNGDDSEQQYIGTYALSDRANEYDFGDSTCRKATIAVTPGSGVVAAQWTLRNISTNCVGTYSPAVNVLAAYDEDAFNALTTSQDNTATLPATSRVGTLTCEVVLVNPLTWFMCPIISAATSAANQLDSSINSMLSIDTNLYLGGDSGAKLRKVMDSLRIIAFAIIVIAALVMVIAQASGAEIVDAYTVRKVVPGIAFSVIMIALWPVLGKELIILGDVLGYGIRTLIYSAFGGSSAIQIGQGTTSVMALLGSGALLALGVFATFSFAVTAVIAVATAFFIFVVRLVVIIALYTTGPLFLAFYPLPGTRKFYKFFMDTFIGAIMIFPVLAGVIALSRAFAWIVYNANPNNIIFVLMAFFIYFGVYFMLAKIISVSNRTFANITGGITNATKGLSGMMQNYRGNTVKQRVGQMKQGNLFEGSKWVPGSRTAAQAFNRTSAGLGAGWQGRFGLGFNARGRTATEQIRTNAASELKRSAQYQRISEYDDALRAATYADSNTAYQALRRMEGMNDAKARSAVAAVQTSIGFGATQQLAAAQGLADTGTGYKNVEDVTKTLARVSRGNAGSLNWGAGYVNSKAKEKGNWHLAPGFGALSGAATTVMNHGSLSQMQYDTMTMEGLSTGADPGTIVRAGRQGLFEEFSGVHNRLTQAEDQTVNPATRQTFAQAYGGTDRQRMQLASNVAARSEEFRTSNYGAVSIRNAAMAHDVNAARRPAVSGEQRQQMIESGELRVYNYAGGMPPGTPGFEGVPPPRPVPGPEPVLRPVPVRRPAAPRPEEPPRRGDDSGYGPPGGYL
ncbi:MAG TPA: hypothetical protein VMR45_04145 [Patescibacteria group bacterium]|nr:hypothetical protein [Patescibacteria group bacterium]